MNKIGILTFHGSHNYGSVLQAYALSKQLEIMGNNVEIINLRPTAQKEAYKIFKKNFSIARRLFTVIIYRSLKRRFNHYELFIHEKLPIGCTEYSSTAEMLNQNFEYTTYICGGDQIWNPACQDFEPAYYLEILNESPAKKISYAPSLGKTEFKQEELNDICKWVQKFDSISVREEQGAALIQKMVSIPVSVVCDPVLLLERKYWDQISQKPKYKKPYILCYFLDNNHGDRSLIPYLQEKTGYDVVMLNEYIRDFIKPYHHAYDASPEEFVGLFKHAAFIYTNSFHGTAFATIFQKPFLTAIAKNQKNVLNNNDSRKIDYLKRIGLENRLVTLETNMEQVLLPIDWTEVYNNIESFREQSMNYLRCALMTD